MRKPMTETMPGASGPCKHGDVAHADFRKNLLVWYDRHGRDLPWRAKGPKTMDPYHVWLSEVMLQQTTVQAVIPYFVKFVDKWPTVQDLAAAEDGDVMQAWAGLGYYARARNLLKCARVVSAEYGGLFPTHQNDLKELPGIGDYTSAAIAAIAFNRPATVIDGNVDRVVSRYFAIKTPLPDSKPEIRRNAESLYMMCSEVRPGDFAQAMMDLGATICTPTSPKCTVCPVAAGCAGQVQGIAAALPARKPKAERPKRVGYIYWIENDANQILLQNRPDQGLLGGMTGFPTTEWVQVSRESKKWPEIEHIFDNCSSDNVMMNNKILISHVFTHFSLELRGVAVRLHSGRGVYGSGYLWVNRQDLHKIGMPTVFKKFLKAQMPEVATNRHSE